MTDRASSDQWTAVDRYFSDRLFAPDAALDSALSASEAAGLPAIQVTPHQGRLLMMFAMMQRATRILEIGTLGGYSTLWLARALPPAGRIITLEIDPRHAQVARENFARAGVAHQIDLRLGRAIETLPPLLQERAGPFDLIFIDADKQSTADYFEWSMKLARPGTLIIVDNVVRKGAVADPQTTDDSARGVRRFIDLAAQDPRIIITATQTVGAKGYDGFATILVK